MFLFALLVRWLLMVVYVLFEPTEMYGAELRWIAMNLAEGRGFSYPFGRGDMPTAHLAPAVPFVWSLIFQWTGAGTSESANVIRFVHAIPSAAAVALYAYTAARVRNHWTALPKATPLVVAVVMTFWPESLLMLGDPWYFEFQEIGLALLVVAGIHWLDRPDYRSAALLGGATGLLALINPTPAVLALPIVLAALLSRSGIAWRRVPYAVLATLVSVLMIAPWTARNYRVFGNLIPVRGNMPLELLSAHHPSAMPKNYRGSFHPFANRQARQVYDSLGEKRYMDWARGETAKYVRKNPGLAVKRTVVRVVLFWTTDPTDRYRWSERQPRWWKNCCTFKTVERAATTGGALLSVALIAVALLAGWLRPLPYKILFASIFLVIPLAYYLTTVGIRKGSPMRAWLIVLFVMAVMGTWARLRSRNRIDPVS